jgi:hypothetical protein
VGGYASDCDGTCSREDKFGGEASVSGEDDDGSSSKNMISMIDGFVKACYAQWCISGSRFLLTRNNRFRHSHYEYLNSLQQSIHHQISAACSILRSC